MRFHKYHALGNDYLVFEHDEGGEPSAFLMRRICDRHFGVGSDEILIGRRATLADKFMLRIFNPDGSEAEKSGNGLWIFARYLWDTGQGGLHNFLVAKRGGTVRCQVRDAGRNIFVEMGQASFDSEKIPVAEPKRDVMGEHILVGIERHQLFPNRTNVQFVKVIDPHRLQIAIWERGAGCTLTSGSISCAAVAVAASVQLGLCTGDKTVVMPGGTLEISIKDDFTVTMVGPAMKVAKGTIAPDLLKEAG